MSNLHSQNSDISITIYESTINKLLKAIGTFSDTGEYRVMLIKGVYKWTLLDSRIELIPGQAMLDARVRIETGPLSYTDNIKANCNVLYNPKTNNIEIHVKSAIFKIQTKILGKTIVIKTIDLADYFSEPFLFDGPGSYQEIMEFEMPDLSIKKIKTSVKNYNLQILDNKLYMTANLDFEEVVQPLPTPIAPIQPPSQPPSSVQPAKPSKKSRK